MAAKPPPFDACTLLLDGTAHFTLSPRGDSSDAARIQAALDWQAERQADGKGPLTFGEWIRAKLGVEE